MTKNLLNHAGQTDFLELACISANIGFRTKLLREDLLKTLVSGEAPANKRPHLRVIFDELPPAIFDGLVHQVSEFVPAEQLSKNIAVIAKKIHSQKRGVA